MRSDHHAPHNQQRPWSTLQIRVALSYVGVTVAAVILLEIVAFLLLSTVGVGALQSLLASEMAQKYALVAAAQGQGSALDSHATFLPGQPTTLTIPNTAWSMGGIPYTSAMTNQPVGFVVLIAPNHTILASSYPARYPSQANVETAFPARAQVIGDALRGRTGSGAYTQATMQIAYDAEPVLNWRHQPIGAVYLEIPGPTILNLWEPLRLIIVNSGIALLLAMIPIGVLFGWMTTHRSVHRIHQLVRATSQVATGDYAQRVAVGNADEIGQLESHFNQMAEQLAETIAQRQALASENARLAERGRISRDLHDSVKQQVFAIGLHLGTALSLLEDDPPAGARQVRQADQLAHQAQQELTALIHELRPLALQSQAFFPALSDYVATWGQQHTIATEVHIQATGILPAAVEDGLLRVAQEALANVARHSQARRVEVILMSDDERVTLTLADDGRGFNLEALDGAGVGLHTMRERMQALGGEVTIQSAPGHGTRIVARRPIQFSRSKGDD
jgi:NarL family two-component system sensor histidine kinase LiaS